MAPNPRVRKAFEAMGRLGVSPEAVKPVLKHLLKLYDKNWELIEEQNYRTLVDTIFEIEEEKMKAEKKSEPINEDINPPFKKPNRGPPEQDQVSSTRGSIGRSIIDLEEGEVPKSSSGTKLVESSHSVSGDPRGRIARGEPSGGSKRKELSPVNSVSDEENSSTQLTSRNAVVIAETLPSDQWSPQFALLSSCARPGPANTSDHTDTRKKRILSSSDYTNQNTLQTTYEIASSSCGKVKISLTCNFAQLLHDLHIPTGDEVITFSESICRNFIDSNQFSLVKMLNELCERYLEKGHNSVTEEPSRKDKGKMVLSSGSGSSFRERAFHKEVDITKGTEKVAISLLDERGNEELPNFVYCPQNTVYESAYVHISLARIADEDCCSNCAGDCLSSSIPCACATDTGGEFAYTPEGLLDEKFLDSCISMNHSPQNHHLFYCQDCPLERPKGSGREQKCKGHLLRKFIKECWRKCGCSMQCGNRVVQHGITRKLQVFCTGEGKGWGLRTLEELPKGAFVCEYVGEILTNIELYERNKRSKGQGKHVYPVLLDADWATEGVLEDKDALCLDATYYGNVARFINHRCFDGNIVEIPVQVETPDRHYYHLAFFTTRKVEALEELTWDYGIDFEDKNHPIKAFQCCCGSQMCRDKKRKR